MSANPRLSVLVPVYGVEKYIADCARSLFEQGSTAGVEFIFVDDCTPDRSIEILEKIRTEYPALQEQVHILRHEQNKGLAAARTTAIEAARGEWVLHVDSDDWLLPGAFEKLLETASENPEADLVLCGYCEGPSPESANRGHSVPRGDRETILHSLLGQSHRIPNHIWGMLIRRTLHTAGVMPCAGLNFAEDYAVTPRLVYRARKIASADAFLYGYRTASTGSFMNSLTRRSAEQYVEANRVVSEFIRAQPDYDRYRDSVVLGKLNIKKWILKRGFRPQEFDTTLFGNEYQVKHPLHCLYNRLIDSGYIPLVRIAGGVVNRLCR